MDTLKIGSYGIIIPISILPDNINKREYSNKLCKVVKDKHINKEFNILKEVYKINKWDDYYVDVDLDSLKKLNNNNCLLDYLSDQNNDEIDEFLYKNMYHLSYFIMNNEGKYDLLDTFDIEKVYIWNENTRSSFLYFIENMINAIKYLHLNKICHFDIKPENIVYNMNSSDRLKKWKLIDFGFAEQEPYNCYLKNGPFGTLEYIPYENKDLEYYEFSNIKTYLPNKNCNDWILINKEFIHAEKYFHRNNINYNYIPKADIYSLGRTIQYLYIIICEKIKFSDNKVEIYTDFIENLYHNNYIKRYNILQVEENFKMLKNN